VTKEDCINAARYYNRLCNTPAESTPAGHKPPDWWLPYSPQPTPPPEPAREEAGAPPEGWWKVTETDPQDSGKPNP
jgi:hypothetical protein